MKTKLLLVLALAITAAAYALTPTESYNWWIRMIPKESGTPTPSYEPGDIRVEVKFRPNIIRRDDGVWEITFPQSAPSVAVYENLSYPDRRVIIETYRKSSADFLTRSLEDQPNSAYWHGQSDAFDVAATFLEQYKSSGPQVAANPSKKIEN